mmetsp:Transcript_69586/g.153530  ORF Transcript_69586/g.153530 Transcript_69586/m.153530 type:complete len:710 (-) Transcript_69586:56-2185(-)
MDLRRAKHPAGRRINFYRTEADWSEETRPTEELVKSLHDGWTRRPTAWTRLLTLDRADRSFETTQAALLSRSSVGRSRSQFASVSCDDQARRTPKRPQTQATPGWSLRYCELLGVGPQPTQRRLSRREAVTKVPAAVERFQKQLEMDRSSGNSVFLATKSRGTRDPRVQRYQTFHRQESRMRARRRAIQADVMGQSRRCIKLAFRYMQMNHAERIDYLKKLFDSKMSKGGSVNRPEQYGISNEELKGLAAKMALPEQEVDHLDVQFRHYDFDGSGALDLEEVRSILADIGLSPQNREEKFEVTECINEKVQKMGCEEFEFEAFLDLLKSVRERFKQVQSIKCWRLFHEADVIGRDSLEMLKIMALLETKLGFYLRSSEENSEAINIFAQCDTDCDGCLNLDEFQAFVQKVRAKLLTLRRREEVQIAKKFDLEPEILHEFRSDLPSFWKIFERYSFNKVDQGVRKEDLLPFMVDIGLAPSNTEEPQCLPLIDVISEFAQKYTKFPALLEILRKGRLAVRASLEEDLTASFQYYDRDGSGQLSMQEIYGILEEFEMLPRTKAEQQEVGQVIEQLDRDGSGAFDISEFQDFFQMMIQQGRLSERKNEHDAAVSLNFSDEQFAYLRRTWMSLKPRIDGTVTQMNLAQNMVHLLQLLIPGPITDEPVRIYMRSVQQAPDIAITFVGYLNAVRNVMAAVEVEAEEVKTDRARTTG